MYVRIIWILIHLSNICQRTVGDAIAYRGKSQKSRSVHPWNNDNLFCSNILGKNVTAGNEYPKCLMLLSCTFYKLFAITGGRFKAKLKLSAKPDLHQRMLSGPG